jgi:3-oxoacyl-[acyl-carrier protein] reductase
MPATLEGKVALITGAGQGIGRAVAHGLAQHGAAAAVNDVDLARSERVVAEITARGGQAMAAAADVSRRDAVEAMIGQVVERFGRLDILVNNARVEPPRPAAMALDDWWDRVLAVDLKGAYLCAIAAWPIMQRQQFGRVVNISSVQALLGKPDDDWIAYSCAKAGMLGLTRSLARRGMRQGITANAVAPDYIETEVMHARWGQKKLDEFAASVPLGHAGRPEEVADAVLFLVQSGFISGETVAVNGGRFVLP